MKNRVSSILWGVLFIIAGVGFVGNAFDVWNFHLFFNGWWTLFIILPSGISVFQNGPRPLSISAFIIGVLLLLSCQGWFDYEVIEKLIVPIIFIVIGGTIIARSFGMKFEKRIPMKNQEGMRDFTATFGGQTVVYDENEPFEGAVINAIFGGINLDLRSSMINEDVVIDCTSVFGGVDIHIPNDVNIKVSSTPIFGGVSNKKRTGNFINGAPTIYINAVCMFGGVDIK